MYEALVLGCAKIKCAKEKCAKFEQKLNELRYTDSFETTESTNHPRTKIYFRKKWIPL